MKTVINPQAQIEVIESNINGAKYPVLREFFIFSAGIIALFVFVYWALGVGANIYVNRLSYQEKLSLENKVAVLFGGYKDKAIDENSASSLKVNNILQQVLAQNPEIENAKDIKAYIIKSKTPNAFVAVNGDVYVTTELLNRFKNDEQLWFVLAHETGHYAHRDILKKLGRTLAFAGFFAAFGADVSYVRNIINLTDMHYSRTKEAAADKYASDILIKKFGTNKGGIEFFELTKEGDILDGLSNYLSTHPSHKRRIKLLESYSN